jgi:hypothetical protein
MKNTTIQNISKPSVIALFLASTLLLGCNNDNDSADLAKAVKLESQRAQGTIIESVTIIGGQTRLRVGESHQLSATGIDSNNETREITNELTWSSSDTSIATVNGAGLVTAVANASANQGIVTITGSTVNDIFGEGEISVSDVAVTAIRLKQALPETGSIYTCIDASIKADVDYDDGYTSLNTVRKLDFTLDENTTATIDTKGNVFTSAATIEHTVVTASIGDVSGQITVTADPSNLGSIDIFQNDELTDIITVNIGERLLVNAQANLLSEISTADFDIDNAIIWSQEDEGHIGITTKGDNKGSFLALKPGVTQLIGTCGGKQALTTLEVKGEADLDTIQINDGNDSISLAPLKSIELSLTAFYTSTPASLNVTEFADWSINGSSLMSAELIDLGTEEVSYKLTSTSNTTGAAIVSVSYDGKPISVRVNIE